METAIVVGRRRESTLYAQDAIREGIKPIDAIDNSCIKGMMTVGENYSTHQIFLPQMLRSADSMYSALDVLLPHVYGEYVSKKINIVIGVVEGDVHDLGKNIVKTMLVASGYNVFDIGRDQPPENFVNAVIKYQAQMVAMSTLTTQTIDQMQRTIDALTEAGLRAGVKIIIGGSPTSPEFADEIGAELHALNAQEAVEKVKAIV
ncbi:MAG: cobalamin-dependent protein [Methanomassiliicoccus sp.]|nr:cobalamin-dependent protein [Methanomassiliicoccus sp.]